METSPWNPRQDPRGAAPSFGDSFFAFQDLRDVPSVHRRGFRRSVIQYSRRRCHVQLNIRSTINRCRWDRYLVKLGEQSNDGRFSYLLDLKPRLYRKYPEHRLLRRSFSPFAFFSVIAMNGYQNISVFDPAPVAFRIVPRGGYLLENRRNSCAVLSKMFEFGKVIIVDSLQLDWSQTLHTR